MHPLRRLPALPLLLLPHGSTPRRILATGASAASPLPWPGLHAWRRASPSDLRSWGPHGPCAPDTDDTGPPEACAAAGNGSSLAEMGALVLSTADPLAKAQLTHAAFSQWATGGLPVGLARAPDHPARPDKPLVVTQKEITTHKAMGVPLNAYMLHNLAHVELNAIDLAWDTVVRFSPLQDTLGDGFFADFARVADDESRHFRWYSQRLAELGFSDTISTDLIKEHGVVMKGPFNYPSRDEAGIPREWYDENFKHEAASKLSEVHDRLACVVEMEKENAS